MGLLCTLGTVQKVQILSRFLHIWPEFLGLDLHAESALSFQSFESCSSTMSVPTFDLCGSDSDSDEGIFLTQVVKSESQALLDQIMTMDENFYVNLMESELVASTTISAMEDEPAKFCRELTEL